MTPVTEAPPFTYTIDKAMNARCSQSGGEGVKMATDKFEHATFYLTRKQVEEIKRLARDQQISRSALVRMIIREYLAREEEHKNG